MTAMEELDALCSSPWGDIPQQHIPANWREVQPPRALLQKLHLIGSATKERKAKIRRTKKANMPRRVCGIEGCQGGHRARGLCIDHYAKWLRGR